MWHKSKAGEVSIVSAVFYLLVAGAVSLCAADDLKLMRFPDIHENTVVFVSGEDIWSASVEGGVAVRLTLHDGAERYPQFSPDGKLIAFTGDYDGNADVYVMNAYGGEIIRVTYHPGADEVVGWHPQKNKILFRSTRYSYNRFSRLFLISPDGTGLEEMILYEAAQGSFSPDGKKIAYNKVARENRTWKRYQGGLAQEVYIYDFDANEDHNISNFRGTDRIPMWIGDKVYFSSDRDKVLNIYSYDTGSRAIEQLTDHVEHDVRRPSAGGNKIVYELGGTLWMLDVTTKKTGQIPIEIRSDAPETRPYWKDVSGDITGLHLSPSGKRALIVARGEVFTVPKENGPTRNLTLSSGARDKDAAWSPDGEKIAYISDKSGEYELYISDAQGKIDALQLTKNEDGYRHTLRWSPDGKKIAYADQTLRCYYLDIASKKITEVDKAEYENIDVSLDRKPIFDFNWSPDSRFIAYSKMNADLVYVNFIYSLETGKTHCVSSGIFNGFNPVFSKDGNYLFFISNRRFDPTFCDFEWEMVYKDVAGLYYLTLRKDVPSLFPFQSDEAGVSAGAETAAGRSGEGEAEAAELSIDFDGIADRIEMLPLPRGNYRTLAVNESALFYLNAEEGDFNRFEFRAVDAMDLYSFSFKERRENAVITGVNAYALSDDGSHIGYLRRGAVGIIPATAVNSRGEDLDLSGLRMWFNPTEEWWQIFVESWRMERDFYYDPNMHGIDWQAMKEKYGKLMHYASCRQDVQFIIGELIGELNTSHTYVFGGDVQRRPHRVNVGLLGVDWGIDAKNNRYRFEKIYRIADWSNQMIPPLGKPGINLEDGSYLLRVNGVEVRADKNIYSYFQNLAGRQVTLTVNNSPTLSGARDITVRPIGSEATLRYLDWVEHNRMVADEASDGQIGYLHLPDTYTASAVEFPKYFYSQTRKKGLIIDGRFNGGGLDPDIFFQRLNKEIHSYWTRRYSHDQTSPSVAINAHLVCLTNRQAGSGGDMLPMEFKAKKMGPVIGTRTWGGLVGVSMFLTMIDGGGLSAPDYRIYDPEGNWVVENVGVEPDIVVDLHSEEIARGYDAQLMKGIEVLLEKIKSEPMTWPKHKPFPVDVKKEIR